jgi:hypothetical protein
MVWKNDETYSYIPSGEGIIDFAGETIPFSHA